MTRYIRNSQFEAVQFEEDWIILNAENYTVTKLNEIGGVCWSLLSQEHTAATLVETIQKQFGDVYEANEGEMNSFLAELVQYGLVRHANY